MNAERLHAVAKLLRAEMGKSQSVELLEQMGNALQNQAQSPQDSRYQENAGRARDNLVRLLADSETDEAPPLLRQVIEELGLTPYLGRALAARINEIFQRNSITPAIARDEVRVLHREVQAARNSLDQVLAAFGGLRIGSEELEPGEFEIAVLVPRPFVKNDLGRLGHEMAELEKILLPIEELATGGRGGIKVRQISSSDFSFFLESCGTFAVCVTFFVDKIIEGYKKILEIKKLRAELLQYGVPEKDTAPIAKHAEQIMDKQIAETVETAIKEFYKGKQDGRQNELKIELKHSSKRLAARIDRGFNIEVRTGALPKPTDELIQPPNIQATTEQVKRVRAAAENLSYVRSEGEPILALPSSDGDENEKGAGKDDKAKP